MTLAVVCSLAIILIAPVEIHAATWEGLVPCGNYGQKPCNPCYVGELLNGLMNFMMKDLAFPLAGLMLVYAGFRYALSGGNPKNIEAGKKILKNTLIGLFIVIIAFFIVDTAIKTLVGATGTGAKFIDTFGPWNNPFENNPDFCKNYGVLPPPPAGGGVAVVTPPAVVPPAVEGTYSATEARDKLKTEGIIINQNKAECPTGVRYQDVAGGCTSFQGMQKYAIDDAVQLKKDCNCQIVINGAAEKGHSTVGVTHESGRKLDLDLTPGLNSFIEKNCQKKSVPRSDGATEYSCGNDTYAKESNHWDVTFS